MALLALFDSVDDTKLVGKAIIGEILPNLKEILATKHGRDVIVYLMVPRSTIWFYPGTLDILKQGKSVSFNTIQKVKWDLQHKRERTCLFQRPVS